MLLSLSGAPAPPRREFLYSEDMADACIYLMNLPDERFALLLGSDEAATGVFMPPLINIGVGTDQTIQELAEAVKKVIGCTSSIVYDSSKPDGTPRKLMDVSRLNALGWRAQTSLEAGLVKAYQDYRIRYS